MVDAIATARSGCRQRRNKSTVDVSIPGRRRRKVYETSARLKSWCKMEDLPKPLVLAMVPRRDICEARGIPTTHEERTVTEGWYDKPKAWQVLWSG
jgi:hypothetical protein